MAQKLVLSVEEGKVQMQDLTAFLNRMTALKFAPRQEVEVLRDKSGTILFTVNIPEAKERAPKVSKIAAAVKKQIEDHQTAVANGEAVLGHTPALIKIPVKTGMCPTCGAKKPVTRVGLIKTHTVGGKKCAGSGQKPLNPTQDNLHKAKMKQVDVDPENTADNSPMPKQQGKLRVVRKPKFTTVVVKKARRAK